MSSPWTAPGTVAGFAQAPPNERLMHVAEHTLRRATARFALDLGCGAGRNAVPLAEMGWRVFGVDLSWPMLTAAAARKPSAGGFLLPPSLKPRQTAGALAEAAHAEGHLHLIAAEMHALPIHGARFDLIVAHGIWNLARSSGEFRKGVQEAARLARHGAELFVFTFSRNTLPADAQPVPGEPFVFTQFSGEPQCFLTEDQLASELGAAGFVPDPDVPVREYNRARSPTSTAGTAPVIYEGGFRFAG